MTSNRGVCLVSTLRCRRSVFLRHQQFVSVHSQSSSESTSDSLNSLELTTALYLAKVSQTLMFGPCWKAPAKTPTSAHVSWQVSSTEFLHNVNAHLVASSLHSTALSLTHTSLITSHSVAQIITDGRRSRLSSCSSRILSSVENTCLKLTIAFCIGRSGMTTQLAARWASIGFWCLSTSSTSRVYLYTNVYVDLHSSSWKHHLSCREHWTTASSAFRVFRRYCCAGDTTLQIEWPRVRCRWSTCMEQSAWRDPSQSITGCFQAFVKNIPFHTKFLLTASITFLSLFETAFP